MLDSEIKNLDKMTQEYRLKLLHSQSTKQLRDVARKKGWGDKGDRCSLIHRIDCFAANVAGCEKIRK